jgi:predicted small secreted protein
VDGLNSLVGTVSGWVGGLVSPTALTQLRAASCAPQQLQQQLDALLTAQQEAQQDLTDTSLAVLVQQLQATGAMLCNIAVPHFCNNAACRDISGPTEVRLVSLRSCVCAGCHTARYCGRDCQRAAWKQHKPVCKALAAAAAES